MRDAVARADPEHLGGVLAALREHYPGLSPSARADLIDWQTVIFCDEPIDLYRERSQKVRAARDRGRML